MKERVCVAGATGHLGIALVEELCSRNVDVVAVARNSHSSNVARIRQLGATVVFVDASKSQESYYGALSSASIAITCLAAGYKNVDSSSDFWAIDRDANIRFGKEAIKTGVQHLLIVATFEGKESRYKSEFSEAKEEAVDVLERECRNAGVAFTVLRPNAYFKDLTDRAFESVVSQGCHIVLGDGSHHINPVAREDVAKFIVKCIQEKQSGEFKLGGPDVFTFREIGTLAADVAGKADELQVKKIPLWLLRLLAFALSFIGWLYRPARRQAALVNWMLYCSTHDAIAPICGERSLRDEYTRKFNALKTGSKH